MIRLYTSNQPSSHLITILEASTDSTTPRLFAIFTTPESLAATASTPVPTLGAFVVSSGTACLCMLDPINALFASSFSRNGMREADTLTICFGETSIYMTSSIVTSLKSPPTLTDTVSPKRFPFSSIGEVACAMTCFSPSIAERYTISSVTLPFLTILYRDSIKPKSFTLAYDAREVIRPILGPSGVSTGQIRP